jgi:DNA repair exonuclease SbcCD nuclease subunit
LKISIFSDLHFGEAESTDWGPKQDSRTLRVMSTILDTEEPDLVVLNGDLITGDDTQLANATDYFDKIVAPMVQRQIPWASAYGNHDNEFNVSTEIILEKERGYYSLSLTEKMVTGKGEEVGVSNYFVPLYQIGRDGPVARLWFFDSRGGKAFQRTGKDGEKVQLPEW